MCGLRQSNSEIAKYHDHICGEYSNLWRTFNFSWYSFDSYSRCRCVTDHLYRVNSSSNRGRNCRCKWACHVAYGKDFFVAGFATAVNSDVTVFVKVKLSAKYFGVRYITNADERKINWNGLSFLIRPYGDGADDIVSID